jgi:hypothetical protein
MKKRPIRIEGDAAYVTLACGAEAIIDSEDAKLVGKHNWQLAKGYAVTSLLTGKGKHRQLSLHRLVMGNPEGKLVDHREGNKLDNRKELLRLATYSENGYNRGANSNNTSGHKGVSWYKRDQKWQASITHEGKFIRLGLFTDIEEAAKAYREAAQKYHGKFARL